MYSFVTRAQEGLQVNAGFEETPATDILHYFEEEFDLVFSYGNEAKIDREITIRFESVPLVAALDKLFYSLNLEFQVSDYKNILLRKRSHDREYISIMEGIVLDAGTGEPLPMANVINVGSNLGTATDENGYFWIPSKSGDSINVHYVGYETTTQKGSDERLYISMKRSAFDLPNITIFAERQLELEPLYLLLSQTESTTFSILKSLGFTNDINRAIQLLPGVYAGDDTSAGLKVRGGNSDENLIILDGIRLYNTSHYYGIFSSINGAFINEVKLYKTIFPIEYGGRTSSVVEYTSDQAIGRPFHAELSAQLLTSSISLVAPLGPSVALHMAGRTTNQKLTDETQYDLFKSITTQDFSADRQMNGVSIISISPEMSFYDINSKLESEFGQKTKASLNFFRSKDDIESNYQTTYEQRIHDKPAEISEEYQQSENSDNLGVGLRVNQRWTDEWSSNVSASLSRYHHNESTVIGVTRSFLNHEFSNVFNQVKQFEVSGYDLTFSNAKRQKNGVYTRFGLDVVQNNVFEKYIVDDIEKVKHRSRDARSITGFAEHTFLLAKGWSFLTGLRTTYYNLNEKMYFSPRLRLEFKPSPKLTLHSSWAYYNQFLRQITFEDRFGRSQYIWRLADENAGKFLRTPVLSSSNFSLGMILHNEVADVDMEFYYKKKSGVVEFAQVNPQIRDSMPPGDLQFRNFVGDGQVIGADFLFTKTFKNYTYWLAYTLSKSTNQFDDIGHNLKFPAEDDRRHQLKLINSYNLKNWHFDFSYIMLSGLNYTDIAKLESPRETSSAEDRISQLPDYHRLDFGIRYTRRFNKLNTEFGISVFNALDRQNVKYIQYIYSYKSGGASGAPNIVGGQYNLLGRTLNASISISFN